MLLVNLDCTSKFFAIVMLNIASYAVFKIHCIYHHYDNVNSSVIFLYTNVLSIYFENRP